MIGEERDVWERFIKKNPGYFQEVEYDVHVGEGMTMPDNWTEKDLGWAKDLTKKRIDVVAFKGESVVLIEVKRRVVIGTLGQVLGYKFLYEREKNLVNKTESLVIAGLIDKDDFDVLEYYKVKIIVV